MKNRVFLVFLVIITGLIVSCASTPNIPAIQPEELIGTKWISCISFMGFNDTIEFMDRENCVYTLISGPLELTYRIKGNSIIIGKDQFFLEGNTFFYKGNPHWIKQK